MNEGIAIAVDFKLASGFRFGITFEPSRRVGSEVGMGTKPTELENWQFAVALSL